MIYKYSLQQRHGLLDDWSVELVGGSFFTPQSSPCTLTVMFDVTCLQMCDKLLQIKHLRYWSTVNSPLSKLSLTTTTRITAYQEKIRTGKSHLWKIVLPLRETGSLTTNAEDSHVIWEVSHASNHRKSSKLHPFQSDITILLGLSWGIQ